MLLSRISSQIFHLISLHDVCTYRHNLTGVLEGALRSSNAQFEPSFVLDRIGVRLLEVSDRRRGMFWLIL